MKNKRAFIASIIIILLIATLLYFLNLITFFHWIFLNCVFTKAAFWIPLLVFLGIVVFLLFTKKGKVLKDLPRWVWAIPIVLWVLFLIGSWIRYSFDMAQQPYSTLTDLSNTTQVRYMPLEVAQNIAQSTYSDAGTQPGSFHSLQTSTGISWIAAKEPDYGLFEEGQGVITVDPGGRVTRINQQLVIGEGRILWNGINWQVYSRHPFDEVTSPYYVLVTDKKKTQTIYTVENYLDYKWNFPFLDKTETWGGTLLISPDGTVDDLTPSQALHDPRLAGQRVYPLELATLIANSWAWWNQAKVEELDGSTNQMPYLMPLNAPNSPYWVTVAEPLGDNAHGTYKVLMWDRTGQMSVYTPKPSQLGPNQAQQYVRLGYPPTYNWTQYTTYEPRFTMVNGTIWWMLTVANGNGAGIASTALVNADTRCVAVFNSQPEINEFLQSGTYPGKLVCPNDPQQTGQVLPSQNADNILLPTTADAVNPGSRKSKRMV